MTDKSIQELALSVERPVEKLLEQVREAGLPQRKADDIITAEQQNTLINHLKKVHGQDSGNTGKIALKRKTTSTAKVTSTSGKAKTINVEVRKKQVFAKPNPEQIAAEAKARAEAEAKARVAQAQAQVQRDQVNLSYAVIRSPVSGVVRRREGLRRTHGGARQLRRPVWPRTRDLRRTPPRGDPQWPRAGPSHRAVPADRRRRQSLLQIQRSHRASAHRDRLPRPPETRRGDRQTRPRYRRPLPHGIPQVQGPRSRSLPLRRQAPETHPRHRRGRPRP